jgi:transcription antitermination factor NusG
MENVFDEDPFLFPDEIEFMNQFPEILYISTGTSAEVFHKEEECMGLRAGRTRSMTRGIGEFPRLFRVNRKQALKPYKGRMGRRPCEVCFPRFANPETVRYKNWNRTIRFQSRNAGIQTRNADELKVGDFIQVTDGKYVDEILVIEKINFDVESVQASFRFRPNASVVIIGFDEFIQIDSDNPTIETLKDSRIFSIGEKIEVISGPFSGVYSKIVDVDLENMKVIATVEIFGKETQIELDFSVIEKRRA